MSGKVKSVTLQAFDLTITRILAGSAFVVLEPAGS
jgi:hypothetical protein